MGCNKSELYVVLLVLYFSVCISLLGLLVMKVAPGVLVFPTIRRPLSLDCCDMGWESPFEPEQDNACEGSVHFYFHVSQDTLNPRHSGNRGTKFSWMCGAHPLDMHVSYSEVTWYAHDFLNQHTYWHFFKGREYLHAHSVIMEHIKFSHTCETSLVKLHKPITTLFFFLRNPIASCKAFTMPCVIYFLHPSM